jgi:uncharacterized protein YdeI (YjbR/CyaY-like superfamily)
MPNDDLPIMIFQDSQALRAWLEENHASSGGVWIRVFKKSAGVPTVTFEELLDEGLCFGWSESTRRSYDETSYLQKFTPRKTVGTQSQRNLEHARALIAAGRMTPAGRRSLGLQ